MVRECQSESVSEWVKKWLLEKLSPLKKGGYNIGQPYIIKTAFTGTTASNIDTADGLTNGQLGVLVHVIYTTDSKPAKLIINFQTKKK